jgi:hypothetical protein
VEWVAEEERQAPLMWVEEYLVFESLFEPVLELSLESELG